MTLAESALKLVEELPATFVELLIRQLRSNDAPMMPNPGYQARVDELLRQSGALRHEIAPMLEVALAAKRVRQTVELVWTGPPTSVVPARQTEQVLAELIQCSMRSLTFMSFGIFNVPRLVEGLELALSRGVRVRVVLGDREAVSDWAIESQRQHLGALVSSKASLLWWPPERRLRNQHGQAGLMHAKVVIADSHVAFLSSANLTDAAFERNMELGVVMRGGVIPRTIDRMVDAFVECGDLRSV